MSEHEAIRKLLPLAAADALTDGEAQRLHAHLRGCAQCAAMFEEWRALGHGLRTLPTPQAPPELVARTRARLAPALAEVQSPRSEHWSVAGFLLLTWCVTLLGWPFVRTITDDFLGWLHWSFDARWLALVVYLVFGWMTTGIAAVVLAAAKTQERWVNARS